MNLDFGRLARTELYRSVWAGRAPGTIADAPVLPVWQWRRYVHERAPRSLLTEPALWVLYPVPGDDPMWVPFGPADLERGAATARSMLADAGVRTGDSVLAVAPPAPWAGNTLPYLFSATDRLSAGEPLASVFPLSVATVEYKADLTVFPFSRRPTVIAGARADIDALLELAGKAGLQRPRFRLALIAGSMASVPPADLSESTAALIYLPGLFAPAGGRPDEPGIWLSPETAYVELIPDEEWSRSTQDPSRVPAIRTAAEAVGTSGELVVTVDNSVLPVVRLRTALRVRIAEFDADRGVRVEVLNRTPPRAREAVAVFTARRS